MRKKKRSLKKKKEYENDISTAKQKNFVKKAWENIERQQPA